MKKMKGVITSARCKKICENTHFRRFLPTRKNHTSRIDFKSNLGLFDNIFKIYKDNDICNFGSWVESDVTGFIFRKIGHAGLEQNATSLFTYDSQSCSYVRILKI